MKNQRQNLIMQIVKDENIGTQEELREALKRHGLKVTQATVSRDIIRMSSWLMLSDGILSRQEMQAV